MGHPAHTIRDKIAFRSSLVALKQPAFNVISALQASPADVQIEAIALTLTIMSDAVGIDAHELITRAHRQMASADQVSNQHLEAIRDYAIGELTT